MNWDIYVNGLFVQAFRRKVEAYAFKRQWLRTYRNDLVVIKRRWFLLHPFIKEIAPRGDFFVVGRGEPLHPQTPPSHPIFGEGES